jgi:spore coat protein A
MNRRSFIKTSAMAGAGLAFMKASSRMAWAFSQSSGLGLTLFGQPLRGVGGPSGIPVAMPDAAAAPVTGALHYSLNIGQFQDLLHPNLGLTTLWGYSPALGLAEGAYPTRHLGGIIVAQKGVPIQLTFTNKLPANHILPVDTGAFFPDASSAFGRNNGAMNAACTHLHGGFVPWISDGGPMAWFTPDGGYGPSAQSGSFNIYKLLNPSLLPGQAEIY